MTDLITKVYFKFIREEVETISLPSGLEISSYWVPELGLFESDSNSILQVSTHFGREEIFLEELIEDVLCFKDLLYLKNLVR